MTRIVLMIPTYGEARPHQNLANDSTVMMKVQVLATSQRETATSKRVEA